ncbi:MAG TPA: hypothetical protein DSN98_09640 [Thermoplasmata archaeon]|nr:MAG TPA: hypothetical protein DSN98_09640 [Thermoplasmata archaeon]
MMGPGKDTGYLSLLLVGCFLRKKRIDQSFWLMCFGLRGGQRWKALWGYGFSLLDIFFWSFSIQNKKERNINILSKLY